MTASFTTGISVRKAMECVQYYGGTTAGVCSIFSAQQQVNGVDVQSIFTPSDVPGYETYASHASPSAHTVSQETPALLFVGRGRGSSAALYKVKRSYSTPSKFFHTKMPSSTVM